MSTSRLGGVAAFALAVAGGAHLAAYPAHREQGVVVAGFFLTVALLQIAAAMLILRGSSAAVRTPLVIGNIAVLALWAWSRTTGVPFGSHPGLPESVGPIDVTAAVAQVAAVGAALRANRTRRTANLVRPRLAVVAVALMVGIGGAQLLPAAHASTTHDADVPIPEPGHDHAEPHPHP